MMQEEKRLRQTGDTKGCKEVQRGKQIQTSQTNEQADSQPETMGNTEKQIGL